MSEVPALSQLLRLITLHCPGGREVGAWIGQSSFFISFFFFVVLLFLFFHFLALPFLLFPSLFSLSNIFSLLHILYLLPTLSLPFLPVPFHILILPFSSLFFLLPPSHLFPPFPLTVPSYPLPLPHSYFSFIYSVSPFPIIPPHPLPSCFLFFVHLFSLYIILPSHPLPPFFLFFLHILFLSFSYHSFTHSSSLFYFFLILSLHNLPPFSSYLPSHLPPFSYFLLTSTIFAILPLHPLPTVFLFCLFLLHIFLFSFTSSSSLRPFLSSHPFPSSWFLREMFFVLQVISTLHRLSNS